MTNTQRAVLTLVIVCCALGVSAPAVAKKGEGHGPVWKADKEWKEKGLHEKNHIKNVPAIVLSDRKIIHDYFLESHFGHCPPGLAKKHNGCLPPGQAKKYYRGQILPEAVVWQPAPGDLVMHLRPPPPGAIYVLADQNVLLISEASRKILDAVSLLSAVR